MNYLSFFSGALGLDLGLEQAGLTPLLYCEVNKHCIDTIKANRSGLPIIKDIRDYSSQQILEFAGVQREEIDLIVGGPPCQAFSTAGARKSFEDSRGNVFLKYLEVAMEIQPKYLVIENVRGLLSAPLKHRPHNRRGEGFPKLDDDERSGGALLYIKRYLESFGYGVSFNLYNAANFGTPQIRERLVIIASRDGSKAPYLIPTHSESGEYGLPSWVTTFDAISSLTEKENKECMKIPEKQLKFFNLLEPGQNWKNLPEELKKEAMGNAYFSGGGKTGFYRRVAWNKPAPTLLTSPVMKATSLAHPDQPRPLSVSEYARLQQFPDDWEFMGRTAEKYKQIGNAVPLGLGFAIGQLLLRISEGDKIPFTNGFKYSRYLGTDDQSWIANYQLAS